MMQFSSILEDSNMLKLH